MLKLQLNREVHGIRVEREDLTHDVVVELIKQLWPDLGTHQVKYSDGDGDMCTLCAATFSDFVARYADAEVFRVELVVPQKRLLPLRVAAPPVHHVEKQIKKRLNDPIKNGPGRAPRPAGCRQRGVRACAAGCGYAATWHPTHCCLGCKIWGKHGPRCRRRLGQFEAEDAAGESDDGAAAAVPPAASAATSFDMTLPFELEDGRRLNIQWNLGDDLYRVASDCALQHDISADDLPGVVAAITDASTMAWADQAKPVALKVPVPSATANDGTLD
eukprot:CAMPEP_0179301602 /NCGR_PEP_ID=MMETSP0797-20121207/47637_1 /TAXON_ID=47934 /ORGANISM="Dinophysis acuminata, Strain DAEP01" /LENGTH=272 /DNA_ID=CAMNT_0021011113 /DNA_START=76 /DNA_END=894 /DNA_ORIENTATION=-